MSNISETEKGKKIEKKGKKKKNMAKNLFNKVKAKEERNIWICDVWKRTKKCLCRRRESEKEKKNNLVY